MAFYLNQFHCIGNLVADPELKNAGKSKVCKFRIAVNNPHNETALFFYVDVWGREGEKCMLLKKGAQVFISNASVIPKQYKKSMQNGEEFSCNSVTINVDGYCGKVQFGPKVEVNDSPESEPKQTKKRGRPPKKEVETPKDTSVESTESTDSGEFDTGESSYSSFEEDFEF
jgi:single-stranded DNA-binding protein